jgi:hypothetical protein
MNEVHDVEVEKPTNFVDVLCKLHTGNFVIAHYNNIDKTFIASNVYAVEENVYIEGVVIEWSYLPS